MDSGRRIQFSDGKTTEVCVPPAKMATKEVVSAHVSTGRQDKSIIFCLAEK